MQNCKKRQTIAVTADILPSALLRKKKEFALKILDWAIRIYDAVYIYVSQKIQHKNPHLSILRIIFGRVGHSPRKKPHSALQVESRFFFAFIRNTHKRRQRILAPSSPLSSSTLCVWRALRIMSPPEITHQRTPRADGTSINLYAYIILLHTYIYESKSLPCWQNLISKLFYIQQRDCMPLRGF